MLSDPKIIGKTPPPCWGCARVISYRFFVQKLHGGGKARVRHKCSHGEWCVAGWKEGAMGWNWPVCPKCLKDRKAEYSRKGGA